MGWSLVEKNEVGSGVWLFRGALQGKNLFSSLVRNWRLGKEGIVPAQRGRSPVIPHVLVHMRMDMAPLSGRTLESSAGHC